MSKNLLKLNHILTIIFIKVVLHENIFTLIVMIYFGNCIIVFDIKKMFFMIAIMDYSYIL